MLTSIVLNCSRPKGRDFSVGVRHAWICGPSLVSPSLICLRMVVPFVKHPFLFLDPLPDLILLRPDQSSRGRGSYRGYPRGNRGRWRGNNSSRGRDRHQNGRGRGTPGSSTQNVADTDEFSQDCRYDPNEQQQFEQDQYGEQYEPEVRAPYMASPSAPPAQFVAPSPALHVQPKTSQ